ncbi:thermopsin [Acidianus sulfidivorans]|nr:thermopsin [Acidianus sulfidivorans]
MRVINNLILLLIIILSIIPIGMISNSYAANTLNEAITHSTTNNQSSHKITPNQPKLIHLSSNSNVSPLKIGDEINPYAFYDSEPAPMGIADYGVSPNGPFIRESNAWLGIVCINGLSAESTLDTPCVSYQLNIVLNYQYNGYTYALWVQDVAYYDTANNEVYFEDAIFNLSSFNANVTGLIGNGQIYNNQVYLYEIGPFSVSLPATIQFLVNVSTNYLGQPVIYMWYNDGYGWVNYDIITVANVFDASNVYFLVDGYSYTPAGLFYDAELVMGGPGDGSCAYIYYSNVYFRLYYWNGHNYQEVRNAYDFGSNTAETVNNVNVQTYYYTSYGIYLAGLSAGVGSLYELWDQDSTTQLTIYANTQSGYVYVYNDSFPYSTAILGENLVPLSEIPFTGGEATLTLNPMNYAILVYNQNGQLVGEANINAYAGESESTDTTQFSVSVNNPTITVGVHSTSTVNINVNAYGNVTVNVISPPGISYSLSQTQFYVYGSGSDTLTITGINTGTYILTVNVTLFPGFYSTKTITVNVILPTVPFTLSYNVIGQSLSQTPEVTFEFPNGSITTIAFTSGFTVNVPKGTTYTVEQIIGSSSNIRWATPNQVSGTINGQTTITITYYEQYLVTFNYQVTNGQWSYTPPTVTYNYFGTSTTQSAPTTVWVDYNSPYQFSQMITNNNERIVAINYQGTVTSPTTITASYYIQYYVTVNSPIPVYALINNMNASLVSNWYNGSATIEIENITYYPSQGTRDVITTISPSVSFTLTSPTTITINTVTQYYLNVSSPMPIYAIINGKNETLTSNWYNAGTKIEVENISYYPSLHERYVMKSISPSTQFTLNSPTSIKVNAIKQYFVTVNSIIPVKAYINGSLTYLNSSWINEYTTIGILNYTYYVNSLERYVIINISPQSFSVKSPITVNISTVKQYLVTINNVSTWYNEGSKVLLSASVPIYDIGEFVGTYNVSPGTYVTVNSPIVEKLVESPNYIFYGGISGAAGAIAAITIILMRKK